MALLTPMPPQEKSRTSSRTNTTNSSSSDKTKQKTHHPSKRRKIKQQQQLVQLQQQQQKQSSSSSSSTSSWDQFKNLLTCKQIEGSTVHDPSSSKHNGSTNTTSNQKSGSCSSICTFRDVVHGNTRVVHRADNSPESSSLGQETGRLLSKKSSHGSNGNGNGSSSRSYSSSSVRSNGSNLAYNASCSSRGMQFRKLSGCYECHTIVDPSRYPLPRTTICACSECGEVFPKIESLEHHQAVRHAVAELGPDDSSRNIVEIIFKSSWLKKDNPICSIERILKVHNTQRTIQRFEDCRDAVKIRANSSHKKDPRCAADGNELLRFHSTSLSCSLGARGSSSLCGSVPGCGVCTIIRHGFQGSRSTGVRTTASSGRAHDCLGITAGASSRRAMLVCRVIAGKVKRLAEDAAASPEEEEKDGLAAGSYDSVAGYAGIYSNLEELYVFNPRAILPCFVVIYKTLDS
ncbi:OLC1v1018214C1 [Oldenlandia corymbosa var. corymbosa]|uniref:OLC1v1018214C1 n=1 Tax=Oldenlandia corymbosa var. corymbosa TaxID=529605 RepID=A0AAV1EB34_OLDCO|nr:OLC1v1018214C1 [Oldenlandia corymbosa var. corymbosa]